MRALITGITGQDGGYLAKLLLEKGYEVFGAYRRSSSLNMWRLEALGIVDSVQLVPMDLLEFTNVLRVVRQVAPSEVYNLAAQSFVGLSFEQPLYTADADALGVARVLEAVRTVDPGIRFYQASTSEMFGKVREVPQTETTPFHPRSPYGVAKLYGHWITVNYREAYDMHASCGLLFNHESPMRGMEFVTRKVTAAFARIRQGRQEVLELGNLDARRDWGHAADYVDGMWRMVQQPKPDDYVLATGETRSVREFVGCAGAAAGFDLAWEGEGAGALARDQATGEVRVRVNPALYRPAEVDVLVGDASKAARVLGWRPTTSFETLVEDMVRTDCDRLERGMLQA
ncbi:MAG: GDP-mannose 4,6-dehydratase [Chthonomonadales bacterium]|nr:GDP-mannose 4,6-dehydratase [Chthonomonadales bacterium]